MRSRLFFFHSVDQFTASTSMSAMKAPSSALARRMIQESAVTAARVPAALPKRERDVADGFVATDRLWLGYIHLPARQSASGTGRRLRRARDRVVGGEDRRIIPLRLGDRGEGLVVRWLGAYADQVGCLRIVRAPENCFQRSVGLVIDDAVEDQGERPGRRGAVQVVGKRCLGFLDEGVGLRRSQAPLD